MNAIRCLQQKKLDRTVIHLWSEASSEDDQAACSQGHGLSKGLGKENVGHGQVMHKAGKCILGVGEL